MNLVIIIGNLGKDVELRSTTAGKSVGEFSIAVKRPFSDQSDWFGVVSWGKQAENAAKFIGKGSKVAVKGYIYNDEWETDSGEKRSRTKINASEIMFLDSKKKDQVDEFKKDDFQTIEDEFGEDIPF